MQFLSPATLAEALAAKGEQPDAVPIMGGTDVMVELNFDKHRPPALIDLTRIAELREWRVEPGHLRLGAGVPYTEIIDRLRGRAPGLAMAARAVASPQIRNRGSVGGNLGGGSPAGDAHPPLLAADATIELASARGVRRVAAREFYLGPRRTARQDDELITAVLLPEPAGPQQFCKIGTRNAMVIAVASFALALNGRTREVGTGIGSAGPTPLRARAAEEFIAAELDWDEATAPAPTAVRRFGELVAATARPIDDVRGSAEYRKHALSVMARRTLAWAVTDYRKEIATCA
ncbi:FAD binding domain-containing protein [Nocardiopsis ansamitocini]|uniref:Carbon-monoxide dehydrogenase medium subunit n=1 Tax=Nocardiopsis ansamitocini TaxID=1670832 RepID=A0A9W6P7U1_9ACTN|nr:FAD binding domain-containing protein [Nocardiopsis ansamitocini]GLU48613.1 carbon-monoxide dehydrogenase medium subunit [Nocardiopsis ansamitocini]